MRAASVCFRRPTPSIPSRVKAYRSAYGIRYVLDPGASFAANATTWEPRRNRPESALYRRYPATFEVDPGAQPPIILTPRPTTSAIVSSEISDWTMMQSLACRERIIVSVALKAVAVLKARKR